MIVDSSYTIFYCISSIPSSLTIEITCSIRRQAHHVGRCTFMIMTTSCRNSFVYNISSIWTSTISSSDISNHLLWAIFSFLIISTNVSINRTLLNFSSVPYIGLGHHLCLQSLYFSKQVRD